MDWRIPLPHIRKINPMPAVHDNQQVYYLQDPLQLSQSSLLIPHELGAIFMLCDGTRTVRSIQSALLSIFGIRTSIEELEQLFTALDEAYLFQNRRYEEAYSSALETYRAAPHRPIAHAGVSYPDDPDELRRLLDGFQPEQDGTLDDASVRGVISPHIDFARGGVTYATTWNSLKEMADNIELAIILGTDHHGDGEIFTLTRQDYATPFGSLPTFQPAIDMMADIFGEQNTFAGELRHGTEHSVEFAAVWLHHIRNGKACEVIPILCDALPVSGDDEPQPGSDDRLSAAWSGLREYMQQRVTMVIAAGDLSHVGPAFGGSMIQQDNLGGLSTKDHEFIEEIMKGDAIGFHQLILNNGNSTNVCGTAPFVHALNLLNPTRGKLLDYRQCPADKNETSWVSICGLHLY